MQTGSSHPFILASDPAAAIARATVLVSPFELPYIQNDIYHGKLEDYTYEILAYVEMMEDDINHPERQGCVAVTKQLAEILDTLIAREVFEDVKDGWLKFCYYYDLLGVPVE